MFYGFPPSQQHRVEAALAELRTLLPPGSFTGDMFAAFGRALGFTRDAVLMSAIERHAGPGEAAWMWRLHTLTWAARNALGLSGDFVECGVFRGFMSAVVADVLDFSKQPKSFYLYDSFAGLPEKYSTEAERAGTNPVYAVASQQGVYQYEAVVERFRQYPNVKVIRGLVPDVLHTTAPERIAYLHIDLNAASAEIGALEVLFDRVTPGGFVIFDDFGRTVVNSLFDAETAWMASRGYAILELPTGQGLVVKR
jgi:hypothetical protein